MSKRKGDAMEIVEPSDRKEADVQALIDAETELARVEEKRHRTMKEYGQALGSLRRKIAFYVRRLNGEDPQEEMEL